jgi:hypothetical protein
MMRRQVLLLFLLILLMPLKSVNSEPTLTISANYQRSVTPPYTLQLEVICINSKSSGDSVKDPFVSLKTGSRYLAIRGSGFADWSGREYPADGKVYSGGSFIVEVADDAPPGDYLITVTVEYRYGPMFLGEGTETKDLVIQVMPKISSPEYWVELLRLNLHLLILIPITLTVYIYIQRMKTVRRYPRS